MRKVIILLMTVSLVFGLVACQADIAGTEVATESTTAEVSSSPQESAEPAQEPTPTPLPTVVTEYYTVELDSYEVSVSQPGNPYKISYQQEVNDEIDAQLEANEYSLKDPFVCIDPYGTSHLSMLMVFEDAEGYASYTIHSPYSDSEDTKTFADITTDYSLAIFGLYPDVTNEITVCIYNEYDQLLKQADYTIDVPSISLSGVEDPNNPLSVEVVEASDGISYGLFAMTGTIEDGHDYEDVYFYDNEGYLRGMYVTDYRADNVLQIEDGFLFTYDTTTIVYASYTGETLAYYDISGYIMHHDLCIDGKGHILTLVTKRGSSTREDWLISIDQETGEIVTALDFKEIFGSQGSFYDLNGGDWLHANAVNYVDQKDGNIIISSRETAMMFSITGFDTGEYKLEYVINEGSNAEALEVDDVNLTPVGDVTYNVGQHSVMYIPGEDENHYQLLYYNNFYNSNSRGVNYSHVGDVNDMSFITLLDIDVETMTFSVNKTLQLDFSSIRSSAYKYQDNYIASSTQVSQVFELDSDFNIVLELKLGNGSGVYKCNKFSIYDEP